MTPRQLHAALPTMILHMGLCARILNAAKLLHLQFCCRLSPCRFNEVRNKKPKLAKYRWQNIGWYFYNAMATGWLLGAKPLRKKIARLRVGPWSCTQSMTKVNICAPVCPFHTCLCVCLYACLHLPLHLTVHISISVPVCTHGKCSI